MVACDRKGCQNTRPTTDADHHQWFTVTRPMGWTATELSWDFCSPACLSLWASIQLEVP